MDIKRLNEYIKKSIERCEKHYDYASVLIQKVKEASFTSTSNSENMESAPETIGFVYKAFNGAWFEEVAIAGLSEELIDRAEKLLIDCYKKAGDLKMDPGEVIKRDFKQSCKIDPLSISNQEMMEVARRNRRDVEKRSSDLADARAHLSYEVIEEVFLSRTKELYQKLNRFTNVYLMAKNKDSKVHHIYGGHCRIGGFEHSELEILKLNSDADILDKLFEAERITPGSYDCIVAPDVAGLIAHEAFGHGTESDMFLKERAKGADYINKEVASPIVSMTDSPKMEENVDANASFFFDNDGTLATCTKIIDKGILTQSITDKYSATKMGVPLTSNSRVESYSHKSYARMTNTYFHTGKDSLEDMIESIDYGFYITKGKGGMEDPKGWGMQVEASCAYEIKRGKYTGKMFSPVTLTGYVPDILKSVSMLSADFSLATLGMCGKGEKEWVKVTDGGPHMKLKITLS